MLGRHSLLVILLTILVIFVSNSRAWATPEHQLRRLSSHEIRQRLLAEQVQLADDGTACDAIIQNSFLSPDVWMMLPSFGGFQSCVAANLFELYTDIENSKCGLSILLSLVSGDSNDSAAFMEVLNTLLGGITSSNNSESVSLVTKLSTWSTNTSTLQGFCNTMNTQAGPCLEALVPALVSLLERDAMCCHELNGYLEVLKLLVPTGRTIEDTISELLNGIHQTMCSTTSSNGDLCSASMSSYLSDVISSDESSLLSAMIFQAGIPLYAADESEVCSSLETTTLASSLGGGQSIPYYAASCCVLGFSSLLQSLDSVITHLSGNSMAELFTLITGRQNAASQFTTLYPTIQSCDFGSTCTNPNFTISFNSSSNATSASSSLDAVRMKTRSPEKVTCTLVELCDSNNVCSEVCEAGTATIDPWVANTLAFQLNLSYSEALCYTQLPGTHNSVITQARGYGNRDQLFNAMLNASNADSYMRTSNQFLSLTDQLNLGARFLELDVHYFASALHDAHCSNLGVSLIDSLSANLVASLKSVLEVSGEDNTVDWTSDLVGCLPSLSGIRADDQRLHNESLSEVATWLANHPNDFIVLFTDIGDEVTTFAQMDALLEIYSNTFGNKLFTPADFENSGSDWNGFTLEDLIRQGKQVILITASEMNSLMFYSREMCAGWVDIPRNASGEAGTFFGETMSTGRIVRAFESELHYATFSESALGGGNRSADSATEPAMVNASSLPVFVEAGVNMLAPDGLDGATMAAMVWTWAENQPSAGATAVQLSGVDGRWYGVADLSSISHVACVNSMNRKHWKVASKDSSCPDNFTIGAPRLAGENTALLAVLRAEGGDVSAQLDVDLGSLLWDEVPTQRKVDLASGTVLPAVI